MLNQMISNMESGVKGEETCFSRLRRRKIDRSHCAWYRLPQQLTMFSYRRRVFNAVDHTEDGNSVRIVVRTLNIGWFLSPTPIGKKVNEVCSESLIHAVASCYPARNRCRGTKSVTSKSCGGQFDRTQWEWVSTEWEVIVASGVAR